MLFRKAVDPRLEPDLDDGQLLAALADENALAKQEGARGVNADRKVGRKAQIGAKEARSEKAHLAGRLRIKPLIGPDPPQGRLELAAIGLTRRRIVLIGDR